MTTNRSNEAGFTLIEVMVAALILVMGAFATFGVLSAATRNGARAEASQVALNLAQQEMERLRSLTYEELAMTATPGHSSDQLNPTYRVSDDLFAITRRPLGNYAPMVVNGGSLYGGGFIEKGKVSPGPTAFTSGDVSGKIFRFVLWRNDTSCPETTCPGTQDYKQVIVAVKLDSPRSLGGERGYVEVQSNFIDPKDNSLKDPKPGSEGVVTAQQFFLSDTPCSAAERQEIVGDHALHNTLGRCADGPKTGSTPGAPDSLIPSAPPDPTPEDSTTPIEYDYSTGYPTQLTPETSRGIQLVRQESSGCNFTPSGTEPQWQAHRWVTDPIPATLPEGFRMNGKVTLKFFTRALNDASYTGKLCVYLFLRQESGTTATDTLLTVKTAPAQTYWSLVNSPWPRGKWAEEKLEMNFAGPVKVPVGGRLGVAVSLERATTTGNAIGFSYDHPERRTRLEVETNTPMSSG
jgi:prepilin-type N-terminal cleavage/methylation domain-containing protein